MTIKIEIPSNEYKLAELIGDALNKWGASDGGATRIAVPKEFKVTTTSGPSTEEPETTCEDLVEQLDNVEDKLNSADATSPETIEQSDQDITIDDITQAEIKAGNLSSPVENDNLDAEGIPWDNRIHSRGKTRNADDTWRVSRCPQDKTKDEWQQYVEEVKAELKAVQDIPPVETVTPPVETVTPPVETVTPPVETVTPPVETVTPPVETVTPPVETVTPPVGTVTPPVETVTPPVETVTPPVETVTPPVEGDAPKTFPELMIFITRNNKKLNKDNVSEALLSVDPALAALPLLAQRADLIPQVYAKLLEKL